MVKISELVVLQATCLALASAWLPKHKDMTSHLSGRSLFKRTDPYSDHPRRRLPKSVPIRGVNLGSMLVFEPWMASTEWTDVVDCNGAGSEFDCVLQLGQDTADANFQKHWADWITQDDITTMTSYGLNTIRIPLGYWIFDDLKYSGEHFPSGQMRYLSNICGWAADAGMYVILDLHGAPFAQVGQNADTGQLAQDPSDSNPDFYQSSQYDRALRFLRHLTHTVHTDTKMRNVGMLEVLNEPITYDTDLTDSMRSSYYPAAFSTIRAVETALGITAHKQLHIEMMNELWGSGDPAQYLTDKHFAAYDDHRYLCFDPAVPASQAGYLSASCADNRGGNTPTIVGEWSLAVNSANQFDADFWPISSNLHFYRDWFAAQVQVYERQEGWVFWSWKTAGLDDPRWDYSMAVAQGVIPKDLDSIASMTPCG